MVAGGLFVFCVFVLLLSQVEIDFDVEGYIDRYAVSRTRFESPLFEGLNGVFVEAELEQQATAMPVFGNVGDANIAPRSGIEPDQRRA